MRFVLVSLLVSLTALAADPYTYRPANKRDPFANPNQKTLPPAPGCESSLCKYALGELRLVGIVASGPSSVAMFEDPHGTGLVAHRATQIGQRGGRITEIDRDCITVTEQLPGADGRREPSKTRVCIAAGDAQVHELGADKMIDIP